MNLQTSRLLLIGLTAAVLLPFAGAQPLAPDVLGTPTALDAATEAPRAPVGGHVHGAHNVLPQSGAKVEPGDRIAFQTDASYSQPSGDGGFSVEWRCSPVSGASGDGQALVDNSQCPKFVIDNEDLVGNPRLMVDPYNPDYVVIHELHGGKGMRNPLEGDDGPGPPDGFPGVPGNPVVRSSDEPSPRARWNALHQPHTAFQSTNGGGDWEDNRYYAHDSFRAEGDKERVVYGLDAAITVDSRGRVVVGSLYAFKDEESHDGNWTYAVSLYRQPRANKAFDWYNDLRILHREHDDEENDNVYPKNRIDNLWLVYDKKTDRVIVLWLETKLADYSTNNMQGGPDYAPKSWVMIYVMNPNEGNTWTPIEGFQYVGPCMALGQPLALHGQVFFPCKPAEGYSYPNATADRWQIHALDINSMTTRFVSSTPIQTYANWNDKYCGCTDANMIIVDMADTGRTAIIASEASYTRQGEPRVVYAHGIYGTQWSDPKDVGSKMKLLHEDSKRTIIAARVTAAAYYEDSGNMFFTYQERHGGAPDQAGDEPDPNKPGRPGETVQGQAARTRNLDKTIGVVHPFRGVYVGKFPHLKFGEGFSRHNADPAYQGGVRTETTPPGVDDRIFEDMHDDIVAWTNPDTKKQRVFSVFGDYGVARFGEMFEVFALPFPPLPPYVPTALPLLAPTTNAAANAAAAGVLSALMLLRLLSSKKKVYAAAPAL